MSYRFAVLIEEDEDGVLVAHVPSLPGCHTQARSLAELGPRVQEAITLCLEVSAELGLPVPQHRFVGVQQVDAP